MKFMKELFICMLWGIVILILLTILSSLWLLSPSVFPAYAIYIWIWKGIVCLALATLIGGMIRN